MAKRKQSGFSVEFVDSLMSLTKDSSILVVGKVRNRLKLAGKSEKGNWELFKVDVQGIDGRVTTATVNDPANIPAVGEFLVLPVYVTRDGYLREARQLAQETF